MRRARWPRWMGGVSPLAADAVLATALLALYWVVVLGSGGEVAVLRPGWTVPLSVLGVVPVALRRVSPSAAAGLVCVQLVASRLLGLDLLTGALSVLVVAYTCAAVQEFRSAAPAVGALTVTTAGVLLSDSGPLSVVLSGSLANGLALLVCFFVGRTVYTRRAYTAALEERARTAETNREGAARQAVLDERRRIARELHDVVAHHISVMGVMATGARRTLGTDPAAADQALATIESTGRATLREMRRLLDVLRVDDDAHDAALVPQPGVAGLEALVAQVREAGLPVALEVTGQARPLDPGVDLTAFRIVQEALTNALKHAGPAAATVRVGFSPDRLELRVSDDGRGSTGAGATGGHGLVGMQERVSLYGGSLHTGLRTGGGFTVAASIPLDPVGEEARR